MTKKRLFSHISRRNKQLMNKNAEKKQRKNLSCKVTQFSFTSGVAPACCISPSHHIAD